MSIVLINGLELDDPALNEWKKHVPNIQDGNGEEDETGGPKHDKFRYTEPRRDRLPGEHELVPRLKVSCTTAKTS